MIVYMMYMSMKHVWMMKVGIYDAWICDTYVYDEHIYDPGACICDAYIYHPWWWKASIFAKIVIRSVVCLRSSVDSNAAFSLHLNYDAIN